MTRQLKPAKFAFQNPHDPREELVVELCEFNSYINLIRDGFGQYRISSEDMTRQQLKALLTTMRDNKEYSKQFLARRKNSLHLLIENCLGCEWETRLKLCKMFNLP